MRNHSFVFLCGLLAFLVACSAEPEEKTQANTPSVTVHTTVTIDEEAPNSPPAQEKAVAPDTSQALEYDTLSSSLGLYPQGSARIANFHIQLTKLPKSGGITPTQILHTIRKAALNKEHEISVDRVKIFLTPCKGLIGTGSLGTCAYTPSGKLRGAKCPVWQSAVPEKAIPVTELRAMRLNGFTEKFCVKDPAPDALTIRYDSPETGQALKYDFLKAEAGGTPSATIVEATILLRPDLTNEKIITPAQVGQSIVHAAQAVRKETRGDVIKIFVASSDVFMEKDLLGLGTYVYATKYLGDPCPMWKIEVPNRAIPSKDMDAMLARGVSKEYKKYVYFKSPYSVE
ncbi:hypothetical protein [Desulfobaculum bizertense]|uniref:Lipoprotein n=1 Tax=Desulfobaculum bizertense DSM 18034 TaxID=1121442 RepID=A0A1T4WWK9_9BACT|nr:hypothetical protein [Desulfobaculum bizertense]SKA81733.1 hypothetical protein SAMN02745702_02749 [Desulfobaculum bizertense DSM 18034]